MGVVIDLAARAVAFITVAQDILYFIKDQEINEDLQPVILSLKTEDFIFLLDKAKKQERFKERLIELVRNNDKTLDSGEALTVCFKKIKALHKWILEDKDLISKLKYDHLEPLQNQNCFHQPKQIIQKLDSYPAPYQWRSAIREVLYSSPGARIGLAKALDFLPAIVKMCVKSEKLKGWKENEKVLKFLKDDDHLYKNLVGKEIPMPFEIIYRQELKEICKSRKKRNPLLEKKNRDPIQSVKKKIGDPIQKAKTLKLRALAFSGGGIRSATFNLGILQGLAKHDLLPKFDYLSTVSGGGYLGAWFAAWVYRDGLLLKVQDRLNPEKSADPRGEEVRPIRWLRMFSNYLSPNSSMMSSDSWTVGLTWFRNTFLNQLIILLLVCSILLLGFCTFLYWNDNFWPQNTSASNAFTIFSVLLIGGALVAGLGMGAYRTDLFPSSYLKTPNPYLITNILVILSFLTAFWVSSWLFHNNIPIESFVLIEKFQTLSGIVVIGTLSLIIVAVLGRYEANLPGKNLKEKIGHGFLALIFTVLSAILGVVFLTLAWWLINYLAQSASTDSWENLRELYNNESFNWARFFKTREFIARLVFIIGPPLIIEVLSITVIFRMALLGNYFPDSRREWWARVGALAHRLVLVWIFLGIIGLLGGKILEVLFITMSVYLTTIAGGWVALLITAIRLAYSSETPTQENGSKSVGLKVKNILVRVAPYLFMVGLLLIASKVIYLILNDNRFNIDLQYQNVNLSKEFLLTCAFVFVTLILTWRVGVNEFSMHHFYRNRLMRGYLAATRRRSDRKRTANSFTGFDDKDDLKLCSLITEKGYHGPYLIINTTLNASQVTDLDRQDRKGESFAFTPLFCGFDISPTRSSVNQKYNSHDYGYRLTKQYAYEAKNLPNGKEEPGGPNLSTVMAISGAAANPNMGTHTSAATAFLLTLFNARLGWWMGNPRGQSYKKSDPNLGLAYLVYDLLGRTSTAKDFVCLSDGGHFDNMGLYELIRRRVRVILLGDAEQDKHLNCEGLANTIRRCRIDFGVEIIIDNIADITKKDKKTGYSVCQYALGTIWYPEDPAGEPSGSLIYLKSSMNGKEPVDVKEYSEINHDFPHQSTADQFFSEAQFESYRRLGLHIIETALADPKIKSLL